jgi:alpha-tubulin suppressor-like RCC1 family protein
VSLGVGVGHACAVQANGELSCWGSDVSGQLGNGSSTGSRNTPGTAIFGSSNPALTVFGGLSHTCALTTNGMFCWGSDAVGQLGNGNATTGDQHAPVALTTPDYTDFIPPFTWSYTNSTFHRGRILDVGEDHACTVVPAGSFVNVAASLPDAGASPSRVGTTGIACWGRNNRGQLGLGTTLNQPRPRFVTGFSGAPTAVATGKEHTCALRADGLVFCWGSNAMGQLGVPLTTAE